MRDARGRSFERLYREHYPFVWRCLRRLGVHGETEDAAQEVFVTAYRRLHTYEGRSSMQAWLAGIARKIAFRSRRTDERRQRRHEALTPPPNPADLESWLRRKEAMAFLDAFLDGLDPDKRSVFVLCELEGLRGRQAAAALGVNQNTAYARLRAARSAFERACARLRSDGFDITVGHVNQAHQQSPPPRAAQRGWVALVASTGMGPAPAPSGGAALVSALVQTKTAAITVVVGVAALGIVAVATGVGSSRQGAVARDEQRLAGVHNVRPPAPASSPRTTAATTTPVPPATPALADSSQPRGAAAASMTPEAPAARGPTDNSATAATPSPAPTRRTEPANRPSADDGLSPAEYSLLDRARAAYRGGQMRRAAELAEALLREFPTSYLALDARVVLVKSQCELGRPDLAQTAAASLAPAEREPLLKKHCGASP